MTISIRASMRILLAVFLAAGFVLHVRATDALVSITPEWVPFPRETVLATGVLELVFAALLLVPRWRRETGMLIALYFVAVWPANFKHAFEHIVAPPIPDSWWYHGPRLALQPVLIWWALFSTRAIDWPLRRAQHAKASL